MISTSPLEETWNLADLFPDDVARARAERELREALLAAVDGFRGRVLESARTLADALGAVCRARERLQVLQSYASLKADLDTRDSPGQALRQETLLLATEVQRRTSFLRPEIVAGDPAMIEAFVRAEPRLAPHAYFLRDLTRQRQRVLGADEERIVAESGLMHREPLTLYQTLVDADLPRPELTLADGTTIRLTPTSFHKHRTTAHRGDRLAMFPAYFARYRDFARTLGQNLYSAVKAHMFRARVRGYASCLEAALDPDNVPQAAYRNLIAQVHEHLPLLHRYLRLRARVLRVDRLDYADLHCPLIEPPNRRFDLADARRRVVEAMEPLGDEYRTILEAAFDSRWIDWHPTAGKRSGAYSSGSAYATHPYVLLNFNEDLDSLMTLAHEMGHALHSHFSNHRQPFATAAYPIFVAEVASTFNETLLRHSMQQHATSEQERFHLWCTSLDGLRGTLFRQTMFAEFELEIHERAERGEALTGDKLSEIYLRLLRFYHGHDQDVMFVAENYAVEWAAIPHMYYDFYVYQYATGIVAATALARGVLEGHGGSRERYLAFLSSGGSDDALELLRQAGVDLERSEPYRQTFESAAATLDRLEHGLVHRP